MTMEKANMEDYMSFNFDWNYVSAGAPYVTISELGLAFNTPAISLLNNPAEVVIGFDEKELAIGVKDANGMSEIKPYKFYSRLNHGWIRIGCKDFIKYLSTITGNHFSPAKKYVAQFDQEGKVLYIVLKNDSGEACEDID